MTIAVSIRAWGTGSVYVVSEPVKIGGPPVLSPLKVITDNSEPCPISDAPIITRNNDFCIMKYKPTAKSKPVNIDIMVSMHSHPLLRLCQSHGDALTLLETFPGLTHVQVPPLFRRRPNTPQNQKATPYLAPIPR